LIVALVVVELVQSLILQGFGVMAKTLQLILTKIFEFDKI